MGTVLVLGKQRCLNSVARDKERFLNEAVVNRIVETRIPGF